MNLCFQIPIEVQEIRNFTHAETSKKLFRRTCIELWQWISERYPDRGVIVNLVLAEVPENFREVFVNARPATCRYLAVGLNGNCIAGDSCGFVIPGTELHPSLRRIPTGPGGTPLTGF